MAEKSTRVADAASGSYVGTRDANATDASANSRVVTLVDQSTRIWSVTYASPTRSLTSNDPTDLGTDFASLPAGLTSAKLTVGDQNLLVVSVHIYLANSTDSFVLIPLMLDSSNNVLGMFEPKTLQGYQGTTAIRYADSGNSNHTYIICPRLCWNINGAEYIGLWFSGDSTVNAKIYADLVSGHTEGTVESGISAFGTWGFNVGG